MPELPEVETVRRGLEKLVLNKKIKDIRVLYSKTIVNEESDFIFILNKTKLSYWQFGFIFLIVYKEKAYKVIKRI